MHSLLNNIRTRKPLVHCITNYVTANDCANLLLAGGAVPVMADAPEDAAEITSAAQALVLNLGTLSRSRLQAMLLAGKAANVCGIPVVLDPVGVWAASFRYGAAKQLLHEVQFAAVRGNLQEIDTVLTIVSGSHCMPEAEPPALKMASTGFLAMASSALITVHSLPWKVTFFPQERDDATGSNSVTGKCLSSSTSIIFEPTKPVAPTTATLIILCSFYITLKVLPDVRCRRFFHRGTLL